MEKIASISAKEELNALREAAARSGRSVAEIIRDAIRQVVLKPQAGGPVAIWTVSQAPVRGPRQHLRRALMRHGVSTVFVDSHGASIALALSRDPLHGRPREQSGAAAGSRGKASHLCARRHRDLPHSSTATPIAMWRWHGGSGFYRPGTVRRCSLPSSPTWRDVRPISSVPTCAAVGCRCDQLCHHGARPHPHRLYVDHHFAAVGFRLVT